MPLCLGTFYSKWIRDKYPMPDGSRLGSVSLFEDMAAAEVMSNNADMDHEVQGTMKEL